MRTVKQVSDLTGISIRMLHHYDKIGLLKPSRFTESGYRLYDDEALETLQQILFFKELDLPLKEIKEIINTPNFDKHQALIKQKKLLILKCKKLKGLIELINKTLEGENTMSFKEFDMSEYYNVLEEFKTEGKDIIINTYGSVGKYDEFIEKCKVNEDEISKIAIKKYGSIKKYVKAMKKNFYSTYTISEQFDEFKKDFLEDNHPKLKELYKKIACDLNKDSSSKEIQQIAEEITNTAKKDYELFKGEYGDQRWYSMVQIYLLFPDWIKEVDNKYEKGASKFIGEALKTYLGDNEPKLITLNKKLTYDLSKDPHSKEIQEILKEIVYETKKDFQALKIDEGENHFEYTAELYLSDSTWIKANDKNYGSGASKFMGEALKFYCENNKKILNEK